MTRLLVLQHLARQGPGLFAREARAREWPVEVCRLDLGIHCLRQAPVICCW